MGPCRPSPASQSLPRPPSHFPLCPFFRFPIPLFFCYCLLLPVPLFSKSLLLCHSTHSCLFSCCPSLLLPVPLFVFLCLCSAAHCCCFLLCLFVLICIPLSFSQSLWPVPCPSLSRSLSLSSPPPPSFRFSLLLSLYRSVLLSCSLSLCFFILYPTVPVLLPVHLSSLCLPLLLPDPSPPPSPSLSLQGS